MKDYFKRCRAEDKFLRHECPNKTARQRAKEELTYEEALCELEKLMEENKDVLIRLKNA